MKVKQSCWNADTFAFACVNLIWMTSILRDEKENLHCSHCIHTYLINSVSPINKLPQKKTRWMEKMLQEQKKKKKNKKKLVRTLLSTLLYPSFVLSFSLFYSHNKNTVCGHKFTWTGKKCTSYWIRRKKGDATDTVGKKMWK